MTHSDADESVVSCDGQDDHQKRVRHVVEGLISLSKCLPACALILAGMVWVDFSAT
jgi:hypothetical protein